MLQYGVDTRNIKFHKAILCNIAGQVKKARNKLLVATNYAHIGSRFCVIVSGLMDWIAPGKYQQRYYI